MIAPELAAEQASKELGKRYKALTAYTNTEQGVIRSNPDRASVHEKIALDLTAARFQGRTWTQKDVQNGMLGWFLRELADQNGGEFVNLNVELR